MNCINSSLLNYNQRSYTNIINFTIINCLFLRSTVFNDNGAIIYIYNINSFLDIEYCTFFQCVGGGSSIPGFYGGGGAIYYASELYGSSKLKFVCANECMTPSGGYGQFASIKTNKNNLNSLTSVSILKCANLTSISRIYSLFLLNGYQEIMFSNYTNCFTNNIAGISFNLWENGNIYSKFCNNYNCSAGDGGVIFLGDDTKSLLNDTISFYNIISNQYTINGIGIIIISGIPSIKFTDCIISKNYNVLFFNSGSNIIISNSYIDHLINKLGPISYSNFSNLFIITKTFQIQKFKTFFCDSEILSLTIQKKRNLKYLFFLVMTNY